MAKHKTVTKYVATIEDKLNSSKRNAVVIECQFIQTAKQLRLDETCDATFRKASCALGYRRQLPLDCEMIHDTPLAAVNALLDQLRREQDIAENRLARALYDLQLGRKLKTAVEYDIELAS